MTKVCRVGEYLLATLTLCVLGLFVFSAILPIIIIIEHTCDTHVTLYLLGDSFVKSVDVDGFSSKKNISNFVSPGQRSKERMPAVLEDDSVDFPHSSLVTSPGHSLVQPNRGKSSRSFYGNKSRANPSTPGSVHSGNVTNTRRRLSSDNLATVPPRLTPNTVLDGGIRRQLASSLGSQQRMDELRNTLTEWQYQPGEVLDEGQTQNWFEDEDDDDEIQYDNSTFQSRR